MCSQHTPWLSEVYNHTYHGAWSLITIVLPPKKCAPTARFLEGQPHKLQNTTWKSWVCKVVFKCVFGSGSGCVYYLNVPVARCPKCLVGIDLWLEGRDTHVVSEKAAVNGRESVTWPTSCVNGATGARAARVKVYFWILTWDLIL